MEIKLDVLISTSIKQRKPWPRISWIGQVNVINFYLNKILQRIDFLNYILHFCLRGRVCLKKPQEVI